MSNNSSTEDRIDLRLGQSPYLFMVYNVSISWLHSVNGFRFLFWWRDSENRQLNAIYGLEDLRDSHWTFVGLICVLFIDLFWFIRPLDVSVLSFLCPLWHLVQVWYGSFQCVQWQYGLFFYLCKDKILAVYWIITIMQLLYFRGRLFVFVLITATRIKESYTQEGTQLDILNELRCHFEGVAEVVTSILGISDTISERTVRRLRHQFGLQSLASLHVLSSLKVWS